MAQLGYTATPEVNPSEGLPDDYQHIRADAGAFGGQLAQGEEHLGKGLEQAGEHVFDYTRFQGKINSDYEANNYIERQNKLLYGDPAKTTIGPDGKPSPDTGFFGLTGRAASDRRAAILEELKNAREAGRTNLKSPQEQLEYDYATKRTFADAFGRIGTHTETQWKTWSHGVVDTKAQLANDGIAAHYNDQEAVSHHLADLVNTRKLQASLKYGNDPQVVAAAGRAAQQEGMKTLLTTIAVKEPARALAQLDGPKMRELMGAEYFGLANSFRVRAEEQTANGIAERAIGRAETSPRVQGPIVPVTQRSEERREEEGQPKLPKIPLKPGGALKPPNPLDFVPPPEKLWPPSLGPYPGGKGPQTENLPPVQGLELAPTPVAARSGAAPAPAAPPGAPAPSGPSTLKASAYQIAMADPEFESASPAVRQHTLNRINQAYAAAQIAADQTAKQAKEASDAAANDYMTRIGRRDFGVNGSIVQEIERDTRMTWHDRHTMAQFASHAAGGAGELQDFGPGWMAAKRAILSAPGMDDHIADPVILMNRSLPGTDPDLALTPAGVKDLMQTMAAVRKSPDEAGLQQSKAAVQQAAHRLLTFSSPEMEMAHIKDVKGERIFGRFLLEFNANYNNWVSAGKDPWQFLKEADKNLEETTGKLRTQRQKELDMLHASGQAAPESEAKAPPPPANVNPAGWDTMMRQRPVSQKGKPWPYANWAAAIENLRADPTPEKQKQFNELFGPAGYDAKEILDRLNAAPEAVPGRHRAGGFVLG